MRNRIARPEFLVVEDVAAALHLSKGHVRRLLAQGRLPGVRIGKRWLVPLAEFSAMLIGTRHGTHGESRS